MTQYRAILNLSDTLLGIRDSASPDVSAQLFYCLGVYNTVSKKTSALFVTIGTAIALTVGGSAAFWILRQRGENSENRLSSGYSTTIPQETLAAFTFSTNARQWQRVRSFGTLQTQSAFNQQLAQLRTTLSDATGLDYQQDIQPWIGNSITIAFLPPTIDTGSFPAPSEGDSTTASESADTTGAVDSVSKANSQTGKEKSNEFPGNQSNITIVPSEIDPELIDTTQSEPPIIIVPIADPLKARALLKKALGETEPIIRNYNGVDIQELPRDDKPPYFTTVLERKTLVLTPDETALEHVIDTYLGAPSIVDVPGYRPAMGKVTVAQSFAEFYVNSTAAMAVTAANTIQATPPQGLDALADAQGVGATVVLNDDGFTLHGIAWLKEDSTNLYQPGKSTGSLLDKLPQDTLMMVTGRNLKQLWEGIDQQNKDGIKGPFNPQFIRSGFQSMTDLDIDRDVMSWMTKEFALALVAAPETEEATPTAGIVLMSEVGDRTAAEKTFTQLDTVMGDRYQFQVNPKTLDGVDVTDWLAPFGSMTITRGWLGNNTSFVTVGNIANNLVPKPSISLNNNPLFQQAIADDLRSINGYFFLNIEAILAAKSTVPIPPLPPDQAAIVGAVKAIGVTTAISTEQMAQFKVTIITPTLENPGTIPEIIDNEIETPTSDTEK